MLYKNVKVLDGTTGGTIEVNPELKSIQVAVSGRTTGVIGVTGKSTGGHADEDFTPNMNINVASGVYTQKVEGFSMESLTFTPSAAGDDFTVTICQWPTN